MRSTLVLLGAALSAVGALASSGHDGRVPGHLRQKRAWCVLSRTLSSLTRSNC